MPSVKDSQVNYHVNAYIKHSFMSNTFLPCVKNWKLELEENPIYFHTAAHLTSRCVKWPCLLWLLLDSNYNPLILMVYRQAHHLGHTDPIRT